MLVKLCCLTNKNSKPGFFFNRIFQRNCNFSPKNHPLIIYFFVQPYVWPQKKCVWLYCSVLSPQRLLGRPPQLSWPCWCRRTYLHIRQMESGSPRATLTCGGLSMTEACSCSFPFFCVSTRYTNTHTLMYYCL